MWQYCNNRIYFYISCSPNLQDSAVTLFQAVPVQAVRVRASRKVRGQMDLGCEGRRVPYSARPLTYKSAMCCSWSVLVLNAPLIQVRMPAYFGRLCRLRYKWDDSCKIHMASRLDESRASCFAFFPLIKGISAWQDGPGSTSPSDRCDPCLTRPEQSSTSFSFFYLLHMKAQQGA